MSSAEWILDNYYIASYALREVRRFTPDMNDSSRLRSGPAIYDLPNPSLPVAYSADLEHVEIVKGYQKCSH
jgi:hypothetical protein